MGEEYRGLTLRTVKALKDLDREMGGTQTPADDGSKSWAVGSAPALHQTMRHPNTGAPMTPAEMQALMQALQRRKVPPAK